MLRELDKEIRVLIIAGSLPPMRCGVGDYTEQLASELARCQRVKVCVLTSRRAGKAGFRNGVWVYPLIATWSLREAARVLRVLHDVDPDIVHIQYPTQGYGNGLLPSMLPLVCWLTGRHVVQTWHEYHTGVGARAIAGFLAKGLVSGGLIAVRPDYREKIPPSWRWILKNKIFRFVPNASSIPGISLDDERKSSVRATYARAESRVIVYFGFMYPQKRVHLLFDIADPDRDHIVIVGECSASDSYHESILSLASSGPWRGKATMAGFLSSRQVAEVIAAADAVVLPFLDGGGEWNTSIHGAQAQGTFLLTTSRDRNGYDIETNTYYASPEGIEEMRQALSSHIGKRAEKVSDTVGERWTSIASQHIDVYDEVLINSRTGGRGIVKSAGL